MKSVIINESDSPQVKKAKGYWNRILDAYKLQDISTLWEIEREISTDKLPPMDKMNLGALISLKLRSINR